MNTASSRTPMLKQRRARDYEFIFEDLELAFPVVHLDEITQQWNRGMEVEEIAEIQKRHPQEVFLALIHQASKKRD